MNYSKATNSELCQSIARSFYIGSWLINMADIAVLTQSATTNGIRNWYEGEEDIYQWVGDRVKQVLHQKGKFDFQGKPWKTLSIQPLQTFRNGDKYFGQWDSETKEFYGQGIYVEASTGEFYEGYFKENRKDGRGRSIYSNGSCYEGQYQNNQRHGKGTFTWGQDSRWAGDTYMGDFKHDKKDGYGQYTWAKAGTYRGEYKDDMRQGYGTFTWPDDTKYEGQWSQNKMHGEGKMISADGRETVGIWHQNEFQG